MAFKHSVAAQYLAAHNHGLFVGKARLLTFTQNCVEYDISPTRSRLTISPEDEFELRPARLSDVSYNAIRELGFCLTSMKAKNRWYKLQHVEYVLMKYRPGLRIIKDPPRGHQFQFDAANKRARWLGPKAGPNGASKWVYLQRPSSSSGGGRSYGISLNVDDYTSNAWSVIDNVQKSLLNKPEDNITIDIPELPIMITDAGEIICIPQTRDEQTLACVGQKGGGKSYLMHAIIDRMYWRKEWQRRMVILSDPLGEMKSWSLPNNDPSGLQVLNESPRPLPTIHLTPNTDEPLELVHPKEIGFPFALPYKEIIREFYNYFTLEKSQPYFEKMHYRLMECTDYAQIMDIIKENIDNKQVRDKIEANIASLFNKRVMDINTGYPAYWTVRVPGFEGEYNPITAAMLAGIVPIFDSGKILRKEYFPQYFRFFGEDIFYRQTQDPYFRAKNMSIYIVVEEMLDIARRGDVNPAQETIKKIVTQGRPKRIGFIGATQNFSKIEYRVQTNIKYLFTFANPGEANMIVAQYGADKYWINEIKKLDKHEFVAITTEDFVVYTPEGKRGKSKGPFKGRALPPYSLHKSPKEM